MGNKDCYVIKYAFENILGKEENAGPKCFYLF